jgi:predicted negative regulator of RcsB-dependent stress response
MENKNNEHGILDIAALKLKRHKKPVLWCAAAILLISLAFSLYTHLKHKAYQKQWGDLFLAELSFVDSADNSLAAMEAFALKYDNAPAGAYAALTLGNAYYQKKDYTKAEVYFKQALKEGNKELAPLAEISLTAVYIAQNMFDKALSQADAFTAKNPAHFALGQVAQYKAIALEAAGKTQEAQAAYKKISEDYPNSYYALFANLKLAESK